MRDQTGLRVKRFCPYQIVGSGKPCSKRWVAFQTPTQHDGTESDSVREWA